MKQEDKELLFKDLCERLPYGVIVHYKNKEGESGDVALGTGNIGYVKELGGWWKGCKPYLRPMSSMTEEEKETYYNLCYEEEREEFEFGEWATRIHYHNTIDSIDWLNANHFDYRGLLEKGLAIKITEENNPFTGDDLILLHY